MELDSLNTQQSLREAISDSEVAAAKQRHQQVLDFIQQIDEVWREMRWIMDALQYARYKQPVSGLLITKLIDPSDEQNLKKISSTSSHIDCLPSPSPSPEMHRRKAVSDSQPCSDEEGCSEVFLPTDSDYDSSDALSPRDLDLVYLSSHDIAQQALSGLCGSAPDVLQVHDVKSAAGPGQDAQGRVQGPDREQSCAEFLHSLTLTDFAPKNHTKMAPGARPPLGFLGKRKPGKHQHYGGFSRHHRWLRMHSETQSLSLSDGVYTQHLSRACGLAQGSGEAERPEPALDGPRGLALSHAASLPEERKSSLLDARPSVHRIYVESYPVALVSQDAKPWGSLSPPPVGHPDLPSPTGLETSPESPATTPVSEILSSML
ncbi:hypothetical protein TREES_T100015086 [Tupaia chinensis]|uniref:Ankyrin repeat and fibronectin type-III domain-containing protein 1 n=3 Tax=Tupaia chinensis TaxID=246437 RepID=L9KKF1_TUPCH|nr:hypothetical protein TREES_T100015086 [Tupaia chinensis]